VRSEDLFDLLLRAAGAPSPPPPETLGELVERLAARRPPEGALSERDRARLEALGYLE